MKYIKMWKQIELLEYHTYARFLAGRKYDLTGIRLRQTSHTSQDGALATAHRTDQAYHFPLSKLQRQIVDDFISVKGLAYVSEFNHA
jgi:hypothetical protein